MKIGFVIFFCCILAFTAWAGTHQTTLSAQLADDYENGLITVREYIAYQLLGIRQSSLLPPGYQSYPQETTRLGTGLAGEAFSLLPGANPQEYSLLSRALSRPTDLDQSFVSETGLFRIHYTLQGYNASADTFIIHAANCFDDAYRLLVDQLGFPAPPSDEVDGPEWDVYVHNIVDYGYSTPENQASTALYPDGFTSFVQIDNDFISTYTPGLDGLRVTAAHEFFHMVQIGMRNFSTSELDSRWFFEATATWLEDVAYDDVNDYIQYLPHYLSNLHRSLRVYNGLHEYGAALYFHMLTQKYGQAIVLQFWQEFAHRELYTALDAVLNRYSSSMALEFADHMVWNYFSGDRADPAHYYEEGASYPMIEPHLVQELEKTVGFSDETQLLSARYTRIQPAGFGNLSILPEFSIPTDWSYATIVQPQGLTADVIRTSGSTTTMLSDVSAAHYILLIAVNVAIPQNDMTSKVEKYQFTLNMGEADGFREGIKQIFPNPYYPEQHSSGLRIDVRLLDKTDKITLYILNEGAHVLYQRDIEFNTERNGDISLFWDGRTESAELVPSGIYFVYIKSGKKGITAAKFALIR
ncbi:MAG: hypothetical protein EHM72_00520 [Calditrichaeota bacterium]|nr:MAG: hypothetical protein EHM72_00520 [Calditrichota bacterium]